MCFEPVHHGTLAGSRLRLTCSECFLPQSLRTLEQTFSPYSDLLYPCCTTHTHIHIHFKSVWNQISFLHTSGVHDEIAELTAQAIRKHLPGSGLETAAVLLENTLHTVFDHTSYVHGQYTGRKKKCVSHASFFLALLSLISFLPKRLKDPPSRVKSYYHHPFFILTTMLRQASTLIRERRRVGDDKATKKSDLRIHRKGHQVDYKSPSYL